MKKITSLFALMIFTAQLLSACPVCEKKQPKITLGLTHGAGPQSNWDWVIIGLITAITFCTLFFSIKYIAQPGEKNMDHIKQSILSH